MDIKSEVESSLRKSRKCILCEEKEADFCVRGMPKTCYCKDCAKEQFSDLGLLESL